MGEQVERVATHDEGNWVEKVAVFSMRSSKWRNWLYFR